MSSTGLYATLSVVAQNSSALCTAIFQVGDTNGSYVNLNNGDSASCNGVTLAQQSVSGIIQYVATVPSAVGSTYIIVLNRAGEAPHISTVTLPEAVTLTSPNPGATYTQGTAIP